MIVVGPPNPMPPTMRSTRSTTMRSVIMLAGVPARVAAQTRPVMFSNTADAPIETHVDRRGAAVAAKPGAPRPPAPARGDDHPAGPVLRDHVAARRVGSPRRQPRVVVRRAA